MDRRSKQIDVYLQKFEPARRSSLEKLRSFVLGVLPDVVEVMRSGMLAYEHDCSVLCELDSQEDCISLHISERHVLDRHKDKMRGLDVGEGCIRFKRFEELPLDTLEIILKEAVQSRRYPWLERLGHCLKRWGTSKEMKNILCIGATAETIHLIQLMLECEASASILRDARWTQGDLDLARRERPDLMFIDFEARSQGMDGWEILEQIKRDAELNDVPVIALFAYRTPRDDWPLFSLRGPFADACLFKPFAPDDLARALCEALGFDEVVAGG